jgi:hypothetical protein
MTKEASVVVLPDAERAAIGGNGDGIAALGRHTGSSLHVVFLRMLR